MHLARVRRNGYAELKKTRGEHKLEKLPHVFIDSFILSKCPYLNDLEITKKLSNLGYKNVTVWNIGYRRRKLGRRKYLLGDIQKHKAWLRQQAIETYGHACELCGFSKVIDIHHVIAKQDGGPHELENLMILCPNCHALITRGHLKIISRSEIAKIRESISYAGVH